MANQNCQNLHRGIFLGRLCGSALGSYLEHVSLSQSLHCDQSNFI